MFTYLIYTHKEYTDILDIHLKRLIKYFPKITPVISTNSKEYILDKYDYISPDNIFIYNDSKPYGEKLYSILQKINTKYILLCHDKNILVNNVKVDSINKIVNEMDKHNIDSARLVIGDGDSPAFDDRLLKKHEGYYRMAVGPALWNVKSLSTITYKFKDVNYRDFESPIIQDYASKFNIYYTSSPNDIKFTGEGHYLSYYFPSCHVLSQGKWTDGTPMNKKYIDEISVEYNINLSIRGRSSLNN